MNIQTVRLTASDTLLKGKYTAGNTVLVLCDATIAAFTVLMPSAIESKVTTYIFKKTDSSSNAVTISMQVGQTLDGDSSLALSYQNDSATIISDMQNYQVTAAKTYQNENMSLIKQLIDRDLTIPDGYSMITYKAEIDTGVTVTVDGDWIDL